MGILIVKNKNFSQSYYSSQLHQKGQSSMHSGSSSAFTITYTNHQTKETATTCITFPDGSSATVFHSDHNNLFEYQVKYQSKDDNDQEITVNAKKIEPANATFLEMLVYSTYCDEHGYTSNACRDFIQVSKASNDTLSYNSSNFSEKMNFKSLIKDFMDLQYHANNLQGYLSLKKFYDYMNKETLC